MTRRPRSPAARQRRATDLVALGVCALGLASTWMLWLVLAQRDVNNDRYQFSLDANATLTAVESRLGLLLDDAFDAGTYVSVAGGSDVLRFAEFVDKSGVMEIGDFVQHVAFASLLSNSPDLLEVVRQQEQIYWPGYEVRSQGLDERSEVALLNRVVARTGLVANLVGLDLFDEPNLAALLAELDVPGEVGILPLWRWSDPTTTFPEEMGRADLLLVQAVQAGRSSALAGWMLVSVRSAGFGEFIQDALGPAVGLRLVLVDPAGTEGSDRVVFDTNGPDAYDSALDVERRFEAAGLTWAVTAWPNERISSGVGQADLAALVGVAVSIMAGVAVWGRRRTRQAIALLDASERRIRHDELTGLLNRVGLMERLEAELAAAAEPGAGKVALLFLDIDRFKVVNDSLGHDVGDRLLEAVAGRLRLTARARDSAARFGGDEFAIVCPEVRSIEQAGRIAQRVLEGFHKPVWIDGGEYPVSVSIGIAIAAQPDPGAAADLVRDADAAMYRAKAAGRGRYMLFDDELRHQVLARLDTEHALHAALHAEQFVVHYQPLVDAEAGTLVELEALLRWNRPGVGLVAPGQFLAVAEDAGLLSMIGDVVLAEAVGQAARWVELRRGMTPIPVSVNIADHHIVDPDFVEKVERVLDEHGLDPSLLTLELSEDLVIERLQPTLGVLRDLRRVGVTLAIDDFGTGRSSLWLLEQLTMVSVLKIDRSFVDPLPGSAPNRAIIKAVVAMAPTLGMRVVAEGVETVGQVEVLRDLGVQTLQGFHFSRALPAAELDRLLLSDEVHFGVRHHPVAH